MAAIKRFFEKKKLEMKFKKAGEGHKLTDDTRGGTSAKAAAGPSSSAPRSAPTHDSRMAGQAALARMSQPKQGAGLGTSAASIKLQVKKELEAERKATALAETYSEPKEVVLDGAPMLAVSGVYFKCPLIGPEVLPKREMEERIHEFLLSQLPEEPEMTSALMIYTLNKDREKAKMGMDILCKYLDNLISNPTEVKYRKIRLANKAFQEKVMPLRGASEFLEAAGFEKKSMPGPQEVEEDFFVMKDEKATDVEKLQHLKEILLTAEPIKPELDRNTKTFYPSNKLNHIEVPREFYNITPEEIKKEQDRRAEAAEKLGMLRTKEMREREQMRELRKYRYCLIRIRFPDGVILQGTFRATEKLEEVMEFIRDHLENDWMPFYLTTQTSHNLSDSSQSSLAELGLAPAVVINFAWDPDVLKEIAAQQGQVQTNVFLKQESLAKIQSL